MNSMNAEIEYLIRRWSFNWGAMDVLIGGKSSIDLQDLQIRDWEDATQFLKSYGYDPDEKRDARFIHSVIIEAWHFIRNNLMPQEWDRGIVPPDPILFAKDARDVLLAASNPDPEKKWEQAWACSLLRVMHTLVHMEGMIRLIDIDVAREQIFGRIRTHVFRNEKGALCFGTREKFVEIFQVDWKHHKSRDSIIFKLLHKTGNVAENIYDYIGMRLVTHRLADVMQVAKYLREMHLVSFPNCIPGRARNSLIDMNYFRKNVRQALKQLEEEKINKTQFEQLLAEIAAHIDDEPTDEAAENPHSSKNYRSMQLTGRQLVRVPSPMGTWIAKLQQLIESQSIAADRREIIDEMLFYLRKWRSETGQDSIGFFPFEVQILDKTSYLNNKEGEASHDKYKKSQVKAARRRVLNRVLILARERTQTRQSQKSKK